MIFRQMLFGKAEDYLGGNQGLHGQQMPEKNLPHSGGMPSSHARPSDILACFAPFVNGLSRIIFARSRVFMPNMRAGLHHRRPGPHEASASLVDNPVDILDQRVRILPALGKNLKIIGAHIVGAKIALHHPQVVRFAAEPAVFLNPAGNH